MLRYQLDDDNINRKVFNTTSCTVGECPFCTVDLLFSGEINLGVCLPGDTVPVPVAVVKENKVRFLRFEPPSTDQSQPMEKWLLSAENFKRQPAGRHIGFPCKSLVMTVYGTLYYWKREEVDMIEVSDIIFGCGSNNLAEPHSFDPRNRNIEIFWHRLVNAIKPWPLICQLQVQV